MAWYNLARRLLCLNAIILKFFGLIKPASFNNAHNFLLCAIFQAPCLWNNAVITKVVASIIVPVKFDMNAWNRIVVYRVHPLHWSARNRRSRDRIPSIGLACEWQDISAWLGWPGRNINGPVSSHFVAEKYTQQNESERKARLTRPQENKLWLLCTTFQTFNVVLQRKITD